MENFICKAVWRKIRYFKHQKYQHLWMNNNGRGDLKMQKCNLFAFCRKFEVLVSQGSVATCLRWNGHCHLDFVANFLRFPAVQKFWKSVKIRQSYRELKGGNFFWDSVVTSNTSTATLQCHHYAHYYAGDVQSPRDYLTSHVLTNTWPHEVTQGHEWPSRWFTIIVNKQL